jgi:hypothetical protein
LKGIGNSATARLSGELTATMARASGIATYLERLSRTRDVN